MKADYGWVVLVVFVIIVVIAWPMLKGLFGSASDKMNNKEVVDRGREVFYSDTIWPAGGENKSCAACHAPDFTPTGNKRIEMTEYREGQPYIIDNLGAKYGSGMLSSNDELYDKVKQCLTSPTRMLTGGMHRDTDDMQALLTYLRHEYR